MSLRTHNFQPFRIFVSWPGVSMKWATGQSHHGNDHQAYWLPKSIAAELELRGIDKIQVIEVPWGEPIRNPRPGDYLICHPDWKGSWERVALPFFNAGGRLGYVMNDPLYNYSWYGGAYNHHGYNGFDGHGIFKCEGPTPYGQHLVSQISRAKFTLCHANDITLRYWRSASAMPLEDLKHSPVGRAYLALNIPTGNPYNFIPVQAPFDKKTLKRDIRKHAPGSPTLIYGRPDHRKIPQQAHPMLPNWDWKFFEAINWRMPMTYLGLGSTALSCSLQEAMPYFAMECLSKGLMVMGGEDWWDGLGLAKQYPFLVWLQAAPGSSEYHSTMNENAQRLAMLRSDSALAHAAYEALQGTWRDERKVNTWEHFAEVLVDMLLYGSPHPSEG